MRRYISNSCLLLLVLTFLPQGQPLYGFEAGINVYGLSYHMNNRHLPHVPKLNETNPGFGLNLDFVHNKRGYLFAETGFFEDSFKNTASYFSFGYKYRIFPCLSLGAHLAYYDSKSVNGPILAPIPIISFRYRALAIHAIYLPEYGNVNPYKTIGAYMTLYVVDASSKKK